MNRRLIELLLLLAIGGCAQSSVDQNGPHQRASYDLSAWTYHGQPARKITTRHYAIYTTITDDEIVGAVAQVAEGALSQYHRLSPEVPLSDRPMQCYLFSYRSEWAQFTRSRTGSDAAVYLQINRGGYTVGDWYVAYFIGDVQTYSVASHEGWHQYVARHFLDRLPPFLEEGLACMFEYVHWDGELPRWNLSSNPSRLEGLRKAVKAGEVFPLEQLVTMHAGQVVDQSRTRVEGFYGQDWAFARFLWEADGGRYRPVLERMLKDAAAGTLYSHTSPRPGSRRAWNPNSARPMLEHYLGMDFESIQRRYDEYVAKLVGSVREPSPPA